MRNFFLLMTYVLFIPLSFMYGKNTTTDTRTMWVNTMTEIADPVLVNLANGTLKKNMPYESLGKNNQRFSYLEAFGRTVCGIAPWLELGPDSTSAEGKLRAHYLELTLQAIEQAVDPQSADYLIFDQPSQPLVDAAFLAQGLLRAPTQLWGGLDATTQQRLAERLKSSRVIKPNESNWLLFASIVEAALLKFTGECDSARLVYGVHKFRDKWYKGDAQYGDGANFHLDYYNSYVIHPMLTDVLVVMAELNPTDEAGFLFDQKRRLARYAEQLERFISPEGTFPAVGRSIVYRTGAFHALAQASLMHLLPKSITPAQVRSALTAVIRRQFESKENFDEAGWLRVGFTGSQIELSESYINTGSLYLCLSGFLPLGLPENDPFWSGPDAEWTNLKLWNGKPGKADHAVD